MIFKLGDIQYHINTKLNEITAPDGRVIKVRKATKEHDEVTQLTRTLANDIWPGLYPESEEAFKATSGGVFK